MNADKFLAKISRMGSLTIFLSVALVVSLVCVGFLFVAMENSREEVRVLQARILQMEREISTSTFSLPNPISTPYQGKENGVRSPENNP